jgi:hypothetical protein
MFDGFAIIDNAVPVACGQIDALCNNTPARPMAWCPIAGSH